MTYRGTTRTSGDLNSGACAKSDPVLHDSSQCQELTGADSQAVFEHLAGLFLVADSKRAISQTVGEVLVKTQAADVVGIAAQLIGLTAGQHVGGASLLMIAKVRTPLQIHTYGHP